MSQTYVGGMRIPATKIMVGPSLVTQIKNKDKDGYWAVQLGFGTGKTKYLREVRSDEKQESKVGDEIKASDIFRIGDVVSVMGISKSKGFAGVVKRWHFKGGPKTHGQSDRQRASGAIGQGTTPGRVFKGKHMAGRMGGGRVTVKNLHVLSLDPEKNEIFVSGMVPGRIGGLVVIKKLSSGSLQELEHEVVAQVVEGEPEVEEKKEGTAVQAPVGEAKQK